MTYRTFTERQPDARRRLLLLDAGAVVSLIPAFIFLAFFVAGRRDFADWVAFPILGFLFLFPLTMAYVIVVHRAMDVRVVVRQGVQYVLARGGIRAIQLALIVAVSIVATSMLSGGAGIARVAIVVAALAAVVAIGGRFADRLRGWVDRRFFREAYDAEQILSELAMQVRTMVEMRPLLRDGGRTHCRDTARAAGRDSPQRGGRLQPAYAVGYPMRCRTWRSPKRASTVRRLQRDPHAPVRFEIQIRGCTTCRTTSGNRSRHCSQTYCCRCR